MDCRCRASIAQLDTTITALEQMKRTKLRRQNFIRYNDLHLYIDPRHLIGRTLFDVIPSLPWHKHTGDVIATLSTILTR